jgi:hypothetical protein
MKHSIAHVATSGDFATGANVAAILAINMAPAVAERESASEQSRFSRGSMIPIARCRLP